MTTQAEFAHKLTAFEFEFNQAEIAYHDAETAYDAKANVGNRKHYEFCSRRLDTAKDRWQAVRSEWYESLV